MSSKRLRTQTNPMGSEKITLSTDEVCKILEVSAKAGVIELKFSTLHVKFGGSAEQVVSNYPFVPSPPTTIPVNILTDEQHKKQSKESLANEEMHVREERLAMALIENPELYEEMLKNGELSDDVGATDGPDDSGDE